MVVPFVYTEEEYKKLEERIRFLEQCLDNKEKVNISLREDNKKLKEDNRFLTKISKEYMKKEHIIEVTEFTELYKDDLEKDNKKLKSDLAYERTMLDNVKAEYENLQEINKKLKEKYDVLEKAKFEVMAYINMCHPKTYMEAEKLQKMKEMFERIYNEKLYFLEKENNELKEEI